MEKRVRPPKSVDTDVDFYRSVTCVDTDPGDTVPHLTLSCGHGVYQLCESLEEAQANSQRLRYCSQCLSEWIVSQNQRAAS